MGEIDGGRLDLLPVPRISILTRFQMGLATKLNENNTYEIVYVLFALINSITVFFAFMAYLHFKLSQQENTLIKTKAIDTSNTSAIILADGDWLLDSDNALGVTLRIED